jgi:transcriptional regulator GlxA family with amidase domain
MTLSVGIFVFDDVEALDLAGPYEVFTTASRVHGRLHPGATMPFNCFTIARRAGPVRARAGMKLLPDAWFGAHPPLDLLIVPGGVVSAELGRPEVIAWIAAQAAVARLTASVCTGAFLLAQAGLLDGRRATTHWEDIADLRATFPAVTVVEGKRWVDEGTRVSSGGISSGIHMSLHLVDRLEGVELARATARQMEFDWDEAP